MASTVEAIPVALPATPNLAEAVRFFEQAVKVGCQDSQVAYMLGMCYKRLGRLQEARNTLRKTTKPDANVLLQLGLISFAEKSYSDAEKEFAQAWQQKPESYEAAYNLLLTRLCLGQTKETIALIPRLLPLAPSDDERRFLSLLQA